MNNIPIFYASNDAFALLICVSITSIMENTDSFVDFYIIDNKISQYKKNLIIETADKYKNCTVEFIPLDTHKFDNFPTTSHLTLDTYSRFLIAELKQNINRAIYMDADIVFNGDIKEVFDNNIEEYIIGATNIGSPEIFNKRLNLDPNHKVLQAGLLIINCDKWRKENITQQLVKIIDKNKNKLTFLDMDALNILFENNYKIIPKEQNLPISSDLTDDAKTGLFSAHYSGELKYKPWNNLNAPFGRYFWKYAKLSPAYNDLYTNAKKITDNTYQKYYKLFDVIPFIKISSDIRVYKLYLFEIQIWKIKHFPANNTDEYLLFGFIPVIKRIIS